MKRKGKGRKSPTQHLMLMDPEKTDSFDENLKKEFLREMDSPWST